MEKALKWHDTLTNRAGSNGSVVKLPKRLLEDACSVCVCVNVTACMSFLVCVWGCTCVWRTASERLMHPNSRNQEWKSCRTLSKTRCIKVIMLQLAIPPPPPFLHPSFLLYFVFSRSIILSISSPSIFPHQKINERKQAHLVVIVFLTLQFWQFYGASCR